MLLTMMTIAGRVSDENLMTMTIMIQKMTMMTMLLTMMTRAGLGE